MDEMQKMARRKSLESLIGTMEEKDVEKIPGVSITISIDPEEMGKGMEEGGECTMGAGDGEGMPDGMGGDDSENRFQAMIARKKREMGGGFNGR